MKYGPDVVGFLATTVSSTGAFHDLSGYIQAISGLNIEALTEESHGFGDSWIEQSYVGVRKTGDITVEAIYDDISASGPHAVFGALTVLGAERVIKLKFGTTNEYPKTDVLVVGYDRMPERGALTKTRIVLRPTGAVTNGTT